MVTDFTFTVTTDKTPQEVFQAIKQVRSWWSGLYEEEFTGDSEKLGDEFSFRAGGGAHYSKQKLVELVPNEKIVWLITESDFTFIEKADEWTGTKLVFEISEKDGKTQLVFTHEGLTPEVECYDACAPAWSQYLKEKFLPFVNQ
nr:SRPBCC domain-containing protein [uncultured Fluviicola sp.]